MQKDCTGTGAWMCRLVFMLIFGIFKQAVQFSGEAARIQCFENPSFKSLQPIDVFPGNHPVLFYKSKAVVLQGFRMVCSVDLRYADFVYGIFVF